MAKFTHYAIAASHEALEDAGWAPQGEEDQQATVKHCELLVQVMVELNLDRASA